jgi:hypothetical protein
MSARKLMLTCVVWTGSLCVLLPGVAGAYAAVAPAPRQSSATGLPDGRVYELVSPANKRGWYASELDFRGAGIISLGYSIASANGDLVSFGSDGPAAEVNSSGASYEFVARRAAGGWQSRSATPRGLNLNTHLGVATQEPKWLYFSSDLSHLVFDIFGSDVPSAPAERSEANLYLSGPDPFVEPIWLARPVGDEIKLPEGGHAPVTVLGGSPDLSTVYFGYPKSLISGIHLENDARWGLYEYRDGVLSYAGVLPDGSIDPNGAAGVAMATELSGFYSPAATGNQVSRDGSRVFFSLGPTANGFESTPELYVHETDADGKQRTVLVSQSQLPGHVGEPAPSGVETLAATPPGPRALQPIAHPQIDHSQENHFSPLLGYASPDGSHVFFRSADRLTVEAPEGGGTYDFDVDTGVLEYVMAPGLAAIVTVASDGSSLVFEDSAVSPIELDRWSAGPHGGTVSPIVQLPGEDLCDGVSCVGPAHLVDDDSVLVFSAEAPIAGFNDAGEFMQIFRYDFESSDLSCVSCPPAGIVPSGTAEISPSDEFMNQNKIGTYNQRVVADNRGVSGDGGRVFFDSPDPLVSRATNGHRNVYEWENGTLFLISSGTSPGDSLFLDNSESGGDVFFTSTDELVQGDNDAQFDVYDARVPRPGDNPPPGSVPCQGDVCQGPPSVPSLLGLPASATFNGLGNSSSSVPGAVVSKAKAKKKVSKKKVSKQRRKRRRAKAGRRAPRANRGRGV